MDFLFSISPSSEYSGLISFRMDWLDLLAVQGTLKSLLQHHSSKASILQHSAFFIWSFSHPYMTNEKNHSLDYTDLCWQNNGMAVHILMALLPKISDKLLQLSTLQLACNAKSLQLCSTLCNPMGCSLPVSSVHGASPGSILQWVAMPSSWAFSRPRDRTRGSYTEGGFFPTEPLGKSILQQWVQ